MFRKYGLVNIWIQNIFLFVFYAKHELKVQSCQDEKRINITSMWTLKWNNKELLYGSRQQMTMQR